MLKIEVEGLDKLRRAFRVAPADFREDLDETIDLVGEMIKEEAKKIAPKRTGRLARSIFHRHVAELTHEIGAQVFYAVYVEYGTSRMLPRPYLRPAIEQYQGKIREIFREKIREWLRRRGE